VPPSAAVAQVLMQRDVSLKMALTIAEAAVTECEKAGNSVSVAVVDRAGRLRVFLQGDKAAPHNIELAQRKAYTARTFGRTSAEWASRTEPGSELADGSHLGDRSLREQRANMHHPDVGAHLLDLGEQMAGDQHRGSVVGQGPDEVANLAGSLRVKTIGWFVEHQQLTWRKQGAGNREPLAHAQ